MNIVYLVLVLYSSNYNEGRAMEHIKIPQANMAQCLANQKSYSKDKLIIRNYCIVGVK